MAEHGRRGTYVRGCRCEQCTAANTAYQRIAHNNRKKNPNQPPNLAHGATAYGNWGCRCSTCTSAHSEKMKDYRRRRREREAAE